MFEYVIYNSSPRCYAVQAKRKREININDFSSPCPSQSYAILVFFHPEIKPPVLPAEPGPLLLFPHPDWRTCFLSFHRPFGAGLHLRRLVRRY
jgi:hypothetical protein